MPASHTGNTPATLSPEPWKGRQITFSPLQVPAHVPCSGVGDPDMHQVLGATVETKPQELSIYLGWLPSDGVIDGPA